MPDEPAEAAQTAFIIGPIGDRLSPIGTPERTRYEEATQLWELVFEPACTAFHLNPIRSDKIASPGEIPDQIFRLLRDVDVVLADLSGGNPNVMYELGLRHSRSGVTIQVGEVDRLPFDINTVRTIRFRRTELGLIELRDTLIEMLRSALRGEGTPVSASRVWSEESTPITLDQIAVVDSEPVEEESDADGFMDILAAGEAAMGEIAPLLSEAAEVLTALGSAAESSSQEISASDAAGRGFAGRLRIARDLAVELDRLGLVYEERITDYAVKVATTDTAITYILNSLAEANEPLDEGIDFLRQIVQLAATCRANVPSSEQLMASYRPIRRVARDLRAPVDRIIRSTSRFIEATKRIVAWGVQVESLPGWPDETRLGDET